MKLRRNRGRLPQITFTSDFHELVHGDLVPGPCVLRYDPLRLLTGQPMDEAHRIAVGVRFHPGGTEWQGVMTLPIDAPVADLADPAGQGIMLETTFTIPDKCKELEVWFSCTHANGHTHWDSNFGRNYWLRFPLSDLHLIKAEVHAPKGVATTQDVFDLDIMADASVSRIVVRWRMTNSPGISRKEFELARSGSDGSQQVWSAPKGGIPVPKSATVGFDIVYYVGDRKFTDDNQGIWYLAD